MAIWRLVFPHHLHLGLGVEQTLQSMADDLVIIHEQYSYARHVKKYTDWANSALTDDQEDFGRDPAI